MGIEDEVQSPRIYYKKDGVTYDIAFYSKMTADDAVGYLRYGVQLNWQTDEVEEYYLPYVPIGHTKASHIHVMIGGVEYALLRQGYVVGTQRVVYAWADPSDDSINYGSATLDKNRKNEDSTEGYNVKIRVKGKQAGVDVAGAAKGSMVNGTLLGPYLARATWYHAQVAGSWFDDPEDITYYGTFDGTVSFFGWKNILFQGLTGVEITVWE